MAIQVTLLPLDPPAAAEYPRCRDLLSPEERDRATTFARNEPRIEFVLGRAALRLLLSQALHLPPHQIPITTENTFGKPITPGIHFNLSHTRGLLAIALSPETPVGIDVEHLDPRVELLDVAATAFSPHDLARLQATPPDLRPAAFYPLWTEREAVSKLLGVGLTDIEKLDELVNHANIRTTPLPTPPNIFGTLAYHQVESSMEMTQTTLASLLSSAGYPR